MTEYGLEGLPMFAQPPERENDSAIPLRVRYAEWRATEKAGEIVRYIDQVAVNLFQGGAKRISVNQLFESARSKYGHLNNNWRSFVSREILARHPELARVLVIKPQGRQRKAG